MAKLQSSVMSGSFRVFISHFSDENRIAEEFQNFLRDAFPSIQVFRSSDAESIPTGVGQYSAILEALKTAEVVIILLSSESARRPWVAFEAGYGMGRNSQLFPVLVRGCKAKKTFCSPFSEMQLRPFNSGEVEGIVTTIERLSGLLFKGASQHQHDARGNWESRRGPAQLSIGTRAVRSGRQVESESALPFNF